MFSKKFWWIALGATGIIELAILASGYNFLFQDKSLGLNAGPNGPVDIQFRGESYNVIAWAVLIMLGAVIFVAALRRFYDVLLVGAIGTVTFGGLFASNMPDVQNQSWQWFAVAAGAAIVLGEFLVKFGFYKRAIVPSDTTELTSKHETTVP